MTSLFKSAIRAFPVKDRSVFLTFDDGPDSSTTPQVLDCLETYRAQATFFVIGTKAIQEKDLLSQIASKGHSIGNHSWDHRYRNYFASKATLRDWILKAEDAIEKITGDKPVAFRSPAGIVTPPLVSVLRTLNRRLVLWNHRFYDTRIPFTSKRATKSADRLTPGDIVLLHDSNSADRTSLLRGLEELLHRGKQRGLIFSKIS